jgi:hypothetical protein
MRLLLVHLIHLVHNNVINLAFQWRFVMYRKLLRLFSLLNNLDIFVVINCSYILDIIHHLNYC